VYCDGSFQTDCAYLYVTIVENVTQITALYALAWLYFVAKEELAPFKPVSKFLVVKSVVFFTYWQSVLLAGLNYYGDLRTTKDFTSTTEVQTALQDFMVCIEMFVAACVHKYTFGVHDYLDGTIQELMDRKQKEITDKYEDTLRENLKKATDPNTVLTAPQPVQPVSSLAGGADASAAATATATATATAADGKPENGAASASASGGGTNLTAESLKSHEHDDGDDDHVVLFHDVRHHHQ